MASTPLLGLALPVTGSLSGTWGTTVNNSITSLLDSAVAGTTTLSTDADVTLTTTVDAANTSRQAIILCTGARTAIKTITAPAQSKTYIVINATTGSPAQSIQFVGSGPTTGVTVPNGYKVLIAWNGSDFVKVASSVINLASEVTGTLPVANGGTGLSAGTSGGVLYYSAAGTLASSAALTANTLLIGGGAGAAPSTTTTGAGVLTFLGTPSSANLASAVTDETGSGLLVFNSAPALTNPTVTNYVETPFSANSSTAITLALTNGTVQIITLTGNATITMPTATAGKSFTLLLKQDATGSRTVTWSTVSWPSATAPTITSTASKLDKYVFISDGTYWYGSTAGQNYT